MASLRKTRACTPLAVDASLALASSAAGVTGYTLYVGDITATDYAMHLSREEALRFAAFVLGIEARRAKAGIA